MPQINRIRVNNVKYNFGTQFYDDFMMRFNCSNTLYDLANGGGKSLLMLLLMQNMIPNCTLDDKQPIEKLFRQGSGNTVIHSLIEWKLDPCYQKDNYKYMTTGFCARKANAKADEDDAGAGVNVAGDSLSSSVEYFNYCIFYREFGDNDIKNLPLENNGERITYNGLKAYLRDLEKKDFGVSVKIFEGKGDYLNFLTKYGIYESQWEIVRGINKTEGHVRTYFENSYKTSRKVVEDLLIEEIIQKSYNNTLGVDNDEGTMAQTLMDIKDKLLELSKKHAQISGYDSQITAIGGFAEYVKGFKVLYDEKTMLEDRLYKLMIACKKSLADSDMRKKNVEDKLESLTADKQLECKCAALGEIAAQEASLSEMKQLIEDALKAVEKQDKQIEEKRHRLTDLESAQDYRDYLEYSVSVKQITEIINNRNLGNEEITDKLHQIAADMKNVIDTKTTALKQEYEKISAEVKHLKQTMDEADKSYTESLKRQAAAKAQIEYIQSDIDELQKNLTEAMEDAGVIVAENAGTQLTDVDGKLVVINNNIDTLRLKISDISDRCALCNNRKEVLELNNKMLDEQLEEASKKIEDMEADETRIDKLLSIYNVSSKDELSGVLYGIYDKMGRQIIETQKEADKLDTFIENARKGTYECHSEERDRLAQYLTDTYGDDVVEGHEWFRNLNPGQKRDVFKRVPFVEYGFIIKNDFDRIKEDVTLMNFQRGAYVVPVISENVLYDTKLEVNTELIAFAMKDMHFLRDDASLMVEIETAEEELGELNTQLDKLNDRRAIVWDDYSYVERLKMLESSALVIDKDELTRRKAENESEINRLNLEAGDIEREKSAAESRLEELQQMKLRHEDVASALKRVMELSGSVNDKAELLADMRKQLDDADAVLDGTLDTQERVRSEYSEAVLKCDGLERELEKLDSGWNELYRQYYVEGSESSADEFGAEEILDMEGKFLGLKELIDKENSDISDKEALLRHYRNSMDKCVKAIEYRGSDFDEIKSKVESGVLENIGEAAMYEIKDSINKDLESTASKRSELDSLNAMMNRLDGSIEHGIGKIREEYGEYEKVTCDNPESYIRQHKAQAEAIETEIKTVKSELGRIDKEQKDIYVWNKDLERIIGNAGLTIPDENEIARLMEQDASDDETEVIGTNVDIASYESVSKEYDKQMKLIGKKKDEFEKRKGMLANLLDGYGAGRLADEIRNSLAMPSDSEETVSLADRLNETTGLIQLEKDRVSKGIEDMERIKDNFENRCIQTCCNIKTDLDRLPKLSTIRMDDETISIVGLSIPYVPEDSFKDRMSSYIDETIDMAESFPTQEERLRYIRNRLTWKRLFSVIVTDMNSIRVNLYKRERIKDQSRYLRYEEAVGSTGQSQGIYIQFLIAIINYISSINASAGNTGIIGKTIFIDNPFGAAKDIYIWEPIFALLKTNHVQLIVPARGATPAITGRFDVNYILGQKLTDGRQTTVVVDYYSKTDTAQMEYTRMDYEQTSLFFE